MRKRTFLAVIAAALLCCLISCALAEGPAEDLTQDCFYSTPLKTPLRSMHNHSYLSYWDGGAGAELTVTCRHGRRSQGIMLTFFGEAVPVTVTDADGKTIAEDDQPYITHWIPFDRPVSAFTVRGGTGGHPLRISDMYVLGEGALPAWVQRWETLEGDADLMLVVTHPDDEILWFGGMLPLYAGQRQRKTMVVYMVGGRSGTRKAELLKGLWSMGVRQYPDIGSFVDKSGSNLKTAISMWGGEEKISAHITAAIRRYRPKVVVTQDIGGEYGHLSHIATVQGVIDAVTGRCMDPAFDPESAAAYGTYTPRKLYLHVWKENRIRFDWQQPLSAFGGRTGLEIAREAFRMHESQQLSKHQYQVLVRGPLDCSIFGLYYSDVGPDVLHDDLFENIPEI